MQTCFLPMMPKLPKCIKIAQKCECDVKITKKYLFHFESNFRVFSAPQDPQNLTRMAPVGPKSSLRLSFKSRGEESTCLCNKRVKWSCFGKKRPFWVKFGGVFRPPRTPNTWLGWPLRAPNLPYDSPVRQGEKNWLACAIKESNDHVLAKNGHF